MKPCCRRVLGDYAGGRLIVALLVLTAIDSSVFAQQEKHDGPLLIRVNPLSNSVRSNSLIPVEISLRNTTSSLLEGDLSLRIEQNLIVLARVRIDGIVVRDRHEFRATLPPMAPHYPNATIIPKFVTTDGKELKLDELQIRLPTTGQRASVICFCTNSSGRVSELEGALEFALDLNRFNPVPVDERQSHLGNSIVGAPCRLRPSLLPPTALGLCAFDLVVLTEGGFGSLKETQLETLSQWVAAGGSLCVSPSGTVERPHVQFLNNFAKRSGNGAAQWVFDETSGRVSTSANELIHYFRIGFGRVAVLPPDGTSGLLSQEAANELAAFLWKGRKSQSIEAGKNWVPERLDGAEQYNRASGGLVEAGSLAHRPIRGLGRMLEAAIPRDIRLIPFEMIGLILLLYIVAIGPADYIVLGWFRKRKWTWIAFPLVTFAFTLFTIGLSNWYLSSNREGQEFYVYDVSDDGNVARLNRFQLLFSGRRINHSTDHRNTLLTGIDHYQFAGAASIGGRGYGNSGSFVVPHYSGRFPESYTSGQQLAQWAPLLHRELSIAPNVEMPDFEWDSPGSPHAPNNRQSLAARVRQSFGGDTSAWLIVGRKADGVTQHQLLFSSSHEFLTQAAYDQLQNPTGANLLHELCERQPLGMFAVVSQVSPTGGPNFEDLSILDASDSRQALLVIVTSDDSAIRMYRRLYHLPEKR